MSPAVEEERAAAGRRTARAVSGLFPGYGVSAHCRAACGSHRRDRAAPRGELPDRGRGIGDAWALGSPAADRPTAGAGCGIAGGVFGPTSPVTGGGGERAGLDPVGLSVMPGPRPLGGELAALRFPFRRCRAVLGRGAAQMPSSAPYPRTNPCRAFRRLQRMPARGEVWARQVRAPGPPDGARGKRVRGVGVLGEGEKARLPWRASEAVFYGRLAPVGRMVPVAGMARASGRGPARADTADP